MDSGGNFSEIAAGHKRRCQQEFENYLQQLVPWLQSNEPQESLTLVLDEMELWRASNVRQHLVFDTESPAGEEESLEAAEMHSEMLEAEADNGDTGDGDEELDEEQVQHFCDKELHAVFVSSLQLQGYTPIDVHDFPQCMHAGWDQNARNSAEGNHKGSEAAVAGQADYSVQTPGWNLACKLAQNGGALLACHWS